MSQMYLFFGRLFSLLSPSEELATQNPDSAMDESSMPDILDHHAHPTPPHPLGIHFGALDQKTDHAVPHQSWMILRLTPWCPPATMAHCLGQ